MKALDDVLLATILEHQWCITCTFWKQIVPGDEKKIAAVGQCPFKDAAWLLDGLMPGDASCVCGHFKPRIPPETESPRSRGYIPA